MNIIRNLANKHVTPIQLNYFYKKNIENKYVIEYSKFIYNEIPIRMSKIIMDLYHFPFGLPITNNMINVIELYKDSFRKITNSKLPKTITDSIILSEKLEDVKNNHRNLELDIYNSIIDIKRRSFIDYDILNKYLESFFISRIGLRALMGNYINLCTYNTGLVTDCSPKNIIENSIEDVINITRMFYDNIEIELIEHKKDIILQSIPSHLYYIFFEILKNSVQAHMESNNSYKPITVELNKTDSGIYIRIRDQGTSFPIYKLNKVFSFSYSTNEDKQLNNENIIHSERKPIISGYGFGLPLARLYTRYLNGDIILLPYDEIGTDTVIYLNKSVNQIENLV